MNVDRRDFLGMSAATLVAARLGMTQESKKDPTKFQVACMTLPYSQFPLDRALSGIKSAGYTYVALYTTHKEEGKPVPVIAADDPPEKAKAVGQRCRDLGLEPLLMFSGIYPEAKNGLEVLTQRLKQAAAGKIPHVLTFGHTKGGNRELWVERFRKLGPIARDLGVLLVVKQHGGETGTGKACADEVRSFCIKDHRNFPKSEDCGPGLGEIDHYKLLHAVAWTGRAMPLCCENIFAPLVPRPKDPEGVDQMARRAREFLETVINGLQR